MEIHPPSLMKTTVEVFCPSNTIELGYTASDIRGSRTSYLNTVLLQPATSEDAFRCSTATFVQAVLLSSNINASNLSPSLDPASTHQGRPAIL
ncbi:unnamed protein product [Somion occarium]|uniref:Uncharacterized protein n=1 Tax=Somion occarium TaxID=3059160 RepID=A0ABP1DH58_9APHY